MISIYNAKIFVQLWFFKWFIILKQTGKKAIDQKKKMHNFCKPFRERKKKTQKIKETDCISIGNVQILPCQTGMSRFV